MQVLHIFDSYAQDQEIEKEDAETMEVSYINHDDEDDDDEFKSRRKGRGQASSFREKFIIYFSRKEIDWRPVSKGARTPSQ